MSGKNWPGISRPVGPTTHWLASAARDFESRLVEDEKAFSQIEKTQVIARQIETDIDFLAWELRPLIWMILG